MSFNDFVLINKLKSKATSIINIQQVVCSFGLDSVDIRLRDGPFSCDIGIVNLQPTKRTHWVTYINEIYFDSDVVFLLENFLHSL